MTDTENTQDIIMQLKAGTATRTSDRHDFSDVEIGRNAIQPLTRGDLSSELSSHESRYSSEKQRLKDDGGCNHYEDEDTECRAKQHDLNATSRQKDDELPAADIDGFRHERITRHRLANLAAQAGSAQPKEPGRVIPNVKTRRGGVTGRRTSAATNNAEGTDELNVLCACGGTQVRQTGQFYKIYNWRF
jgi:hypothetical protein